MITIPRRLCSLVEELATAIESLMDGAEFDANAEVLAARVRRLAKITLAKVKKQP